MKLKSFYVIFALAAVFDLIISPWLFGVGWLPKMVLVLLPFAFIFLPSRGMWAVFIATLVYWRAAASFNIGIIFLALVLFLAFERWFIVNFFHKTAWQTMIFSGAGILIFYAVLAGASGILAPQTIIIDLGTVISCVLGMAFGILANVILLKIYKQYVV